MEDGGGVEEALNEWNTKGVCVIDMGTVLSRTRASDTRGNDTVLPLPPVPVRDGEAFLWFVCECRKMSTIVSPYMPYLYPSDCSPAETFPTEIS